MSSKSLTELTQATTINKTDLTHLNQSLIDKKATIDAITKHMIRESDYGFATGTITANTTVSDITNQQVYYLIDTDTAAAEIILTLPFASGVTGGLIIANNTGSNYKAGIVYQSSTSKTLPPGAIAIFRFDGSAWQYGSDENIATLASSDQVNIGQTLASCIIITGTTTITAFDTVKAGIKRTLRFSSALTITYNSTSMILPGSASITVSAGDVMEFISLGSGNWECIDYQPIGGNVKKAGDTIDGALAVTGATTLTGTLTANGGIIDNGALSVTGAATLGNTLAVTGVTTLTGKLTANGGITDSGTLAVTGATTLTGKLTANGGIADNGALTVTGAATLGSTLTVAGELTANGGITGIAFVGYSNLKIEVTDDLTITVTADCLTVHNAAMTCSRLLTNVSKSYTFSSPAAGTWYPVYVCCDSSGAISIAVSATTAATYAYYCRYGYVRAYSTSYLYKTIQYGNEVQYIVDGAVLTGLRKLASGSSGSISTPTWTAVSTSSFVPTTAKSIKIEGNTSDSGGIMIVAPNSNYGIHDSTTNPPIYQMQNTSNRCIFGGFVSVILESAYIYWASNASGNYLYCLGWEDNL